MAWLLLGMALFLGVHSVGALAPGVRGAAIARLGDGPWKGLYSVIAAVGLGLLSWGFLVARAEPAVVLWTSPPWMRHVTLALLLPSFVLLTAAYLPGRIRDLAGGHPMLAGTALWAGAHLLSNGMLHEVVLFGGFLAWAVLDRWSFRTRTQQIAMAPRSPWNDALALGIGVALWAGTLAGLHRWLLGVAPLPSLNLF